MEVGESPQIEIPEEVTQHGEDLEVDVSEFLTDVVNNLGKLRKEMIDEISTKKRRFSPELDLIISQVGKFTQLKTKLKNEAEAYLQTLYSKWLSSLETVLNVVNTKVDAIIEESTLRTSDFTSVVATGSPYSAAKQENRASTGLYPNVHDLIEPMPRGLFSSSAANSGSKMLRKSTGFELLRSNSSQATSSRSLTRKSAGFAIKEEDVGSRRKSQTLSLEEKIKIIEAKEIQKMSINAIMGLFGCSRVQLNSILKEKEEIKQEWLKGNKPSKKISTKDKQVNRLVWDWFVKERSKSVPISGRMIQNTANQIAKDLGYGIFKASFVWLEAFKNRYHIAWNPSDECGNSTLESEGNADSFEEEEEEEEEEVEEPVRVTKSAASQLRKGNTTKMSLKRGNEADPVLSPPSKRTRRSMAPSSEKIAIDSPITMSKKRKSSFLCPAFQGGAKAIKEMSRSIWKPVLSIESEDVLENPAVYQIKVHQAKKPAFIGACDNIRSQIVKYQKGESTKQKQLDKFLDRNRNDAEISFTCFNSLADAKTRCAEEMNKFNEQFNRNPVFNV